MDEWIEHTGEGFTLDVPKDWTYQDSDVAGVYLVSVEPGQAHPASVVVTAERPEGVASFADWQEKVEGELEGQLQDYRLLDFRRVQLGDHDGVVRTATHFSQEVPITMIQFVTAPGVTGWTITLSTPDQRFPQLRQTLERIGSSFRCEVSA